MSYIAFLMLLAIAAHAVLAWFLLDPNWKPSGGRAGRGYALVLLLTLLPVALRVPLVLSMAGYLIRVTILRLRHALDDQADFVLGPDGVSGWDGFVFRTIPWSEVSKVVLVDHDDGKAL